MRFSLLLVLCSFLFQSVGRAEIIVDFEDLSFFNGDATAPGTGQYFDGYGGNANSNGWSSSGIEFNTNQWGPGWSYSNVNDTTTAGFMNQWSAFTGTGVGGGGNYALGNGQGAFFNLPALTRIESLQITNTTYSALSMAQGDAFAKKFGGLDGSDPDFFGVTFIGHSGFDGSGSITGSHEFFLADYRFADNQLDYIVDQWTSLDLSSLGAAQSVSLSFFSSDVGAFGINTPTYVAIDQVRLTAVPEPSSVVVLGLVAVGVMRRCRQRLPPRG